MSRHLALFRKNVDTVIADDRKASDAMVLRLKKLTPAEFLCQGPGTWSRLSMSQYHDIVATIAPGLRLPAPNADPAQDATVFDTIHAWWRARSTLARSFYLTTIMTIMIVTATITTWPAIVWTLVPYTLVRDIDAAYWPSCDKLAWSVDGCLYNPTQDLNWDWIAYHAAMPVEELLRSNNRLPATHAPAGSNVIVWRSRGRLKGAK